MSVVGTLGAAYDVAAIAERICAGLSEDGIAVERDFIRDTDVATLADDARRHDTEGGFTRSSVRHGSSRSHGSVRGDRIRWIDERTAGAAAKVLDVFDVLRQTLNASLFLGLREFECHYAIYPTGAAYARHLDRFRDDDTRAVSCVLYLNPPWTSDDGGSLRIYTEHGARDILPVGGTLVSFLSDRFEHEVLPARRERVALTGWFKRRLLRG